MASASRQSIPQQAAYYLTYPFASCLPSTSQSAVDRDISTQERRGLLTDADYDDNDAISLLSNIANRTRRRSRSARRRDEWNRRAAILGCGLFGRPKGQIQRREVTAGDGIRRAATHRRDDSEASTASRGTESDHEGGPARSFGAGQESGDEDAGMLEDEDIAEISHSREEEEGKSGHLDKSQIPTVLISSQDEEDDQARMEEREQAARKERVEREAGEYAKAQQEDEAKRTAEEAALAAEEEAAAAIAQAKAQRKAERKVLKAEAARLQIDSQRGRRQTEAEAEAAAGGFDFAEEPHYQVQNDEYGGFSSAPPEYQSYDDHGRSQFDTEHGQQREVVHHHHYYHEPQDGPEEYDDRLLSPRFHPQELPQVDAASDVKRIEDDVVEEDEDDADIAGIAFSKSKKSRSRAGEDGSRSHHTGNSNGSGSGSRQSGSAYGNRRYDAHRRGSDRSAEQYPDRQSNTTSTNGGKQSYRDRPRRHERTMSKSTGSGSGSHYPAREGAPRISPSNAVGSEDQADAAAGGFDDFVPSPGTLVPSTQPGYRSRERRNEVETGSSSSSGVRRERRRERPATNRTAAGLNAPRNPQGANVFVQK